jgi:hypothetical protein
VSDVKNKKRFLPRSKRPLTTAAPAPEESRMALALGDFSVKVMFSGVVRVEAFPVE